MAAAASRHCSAAEWGTDREYRGSDCRECDTHAPRSDETVATPQYTDITHHNHHHNHNQPLVHCREQQQQQREEDEEDNATNHQIAEYASAGEQQQHRIVMVNSVETAGDVDTISA